jgi:hypothetical protein
MRERVVVDKKELKVRLRTADSSFACKQAGNRINNPDIAAGKFNISAGS